jgi:hypothetical protein
MNKIKSHRNTMQSDYVDINQLRKQREREEQEMQIGAFGRKQFAKGGGTHASGLSNNAPLSPTTRKKILLQKEKEKELYDKYMKERNDKNAATKKPASFFNNIRCKETAMLGRANTPGVNNAITKE